MIIESLVANLSKAQTTNSTAASFSALIPTVTKPVASATRSVFGVGGPGVRTKNTLCVYPYGGNDNNDIINVKVTGWNLAPHTSANGADMWVSSLICEVQATLSSTLPGLANELAVATEYFADTLTLTDGQATLIQGTADTDTAYFKCNCAGFELVEITFKTGSGGDMMNALYRFDSGVVLAADGVNSPLPAGTNIIGKVGIDQTTDGTTNLVRVRDSASVAVSVTRTNDTNVYAANDVIGAATGSTAALTFASMGPASGRIMITSVQLEIDIAAVVAGMTSFDLYLYNVTPPSALGDNAAMDLPSGDRASFLGKFSLGTPVDLGSTLYVETNALNKQLKLAASGNLFAYLVTVGTWTPAAQSVFTITLHAITV